MRVWVVCSPSNGEALVFPFVAVQVLKVRRPFDLLNLHLDAQVLSPHLYQRLEFGADCAACAPQGENDPRTGVRIGVFGLFEEASGLLRIEVQPFEVRVVSGEPDRQRSIRRSSQAQEHVLRDGLLVDGHVHRAAKVDVVERRLFEVEPDVLDSETRRGDGQLLGERLVGVAQPLQIGQADVHQVYLVVLIHGYGLAAGQVHDYPVEFCRLHVEVIVALQDEPLSDDVFR